MFFDQINSEINKLMTSTTSGTFLQEGLPGNFPYYFEISNGKQHQKTHFKRTVNSPRENNIFARGDGNLWFPERIQKEMEPIYRFFISKNPLVYHDF